jgi:hypothetical protein
MSRFLANETSGEADLTFQIKLSEQIDRFRRFLNSGDISPSTRLFLIFAEIYIPGACQRLAERCEAMLSIINSLIWNSN